MDNTLKIYNDKISSVDRKGSVKANIEYELRFKNINLRAFTAVGEALLARADKPPTVECTINVIANSLYERRVDKTAPDRNTNIRTMYFTNGVKTHEVYSSKARITPPVVVSSVVPGYTINISEERPHTPFVTPVDALVRLKLRLGIVIAGWRIDFTAVKQAKMNDIGGQLMAIRDQMFKRDITPDNFFTTIPHDLITNYEIEAEWLGGKITTEDVDKIVGVISDAHKTSFGEKSGGAEDNPQYQSVIYRVAQLIVDNRHILNKFKSEYGLKRLLNQVISLSKNTYRDLYPPKGYYLTDKADGVRACAYLCDDGLYIIADKLYKFDTVATNDVIICDCELLLNIGDKPLLLIFDCMYFGNSLTREGYSSRISYLPRAVEAIATAAKDTIICRKKNIIRISDNLKESFDSVWGVEYEYEIDGLILSEPDKNYAHTRNYKWKPIENTTIDFLAVKCPQGLLGCDPYVNRAGKELYLLFVGINHEMRQKLNLTLLPDYRKLFDAPGDYYPVQFSPSIDRYAYLYYHDPALGDIDYKVVELVRDISNGNIGDWKFVRVRTDRGYEKHYFGNDFKVAELIYMNYVSPFNYNDLIEPSNDYFIHTSSDTYMAANRYKRFVISILIKNNLAGAKWVIDLAAGRGADLHRYQEVGVENTLFIDIDRAAIVELIKRKFEMFNIKRRHMQNWIDRNNVGARAMTIHTMVRDLKTNYADLLKDTARVLIPGSCDGVVCNFAIHYFNDNKTNMKNLLGYVAAILKVGGVFIFTTMNGQKVFNALKDVPTGTEYVINDDTNADTTADTNADAKYIIKKLYSGDKLAAHGQKIAVKLPFANELVEEPLANIDAIIDECAKLNLEVELNDSFDVYLKQFENADKGLYSRLTPGDILYISMHQFVSVRKVK